MASQKLSFEGLEVTPDLSAGLVRANKKKRRFTDAQPAAEAQHTSATAALAASSAASSAAAASAASSSSSFTPRSISGGGASAAAASSSSSSKRSKHSHKKAAQSAASAEATLREKALSKEHRARLAKYTEIQGALHGKAEISKVTNSALKKEMKLSDKAKVAHAEAAARAEILLPASQGELSLSNPLDRTWRLSQESLKPALDARTQAKIFELKMDEFGPYTARYTRNGKFLLLAGRKGHVSLMNYHALSLESESHLKDQVEDACFLHNETMYAVAQRKHVYIYDRTGMELHVLRNHTEATRLEFLPYHFLLASVGRTGYLKYQDTSTGAFLTEHRTKLGACNVMKQNASNAVICLGHSNGTVTMWTPNMNTPVVTMLTHRAPLLALGIDIGGNMMASSGLDGQVKIWDIRTYRELHSYFTVRPASTIDVSDQGLLALGFGPHVQVWRDAFRTKQNAPYMVKQIPGQIVKSVEFSPYEDVLGVGHSGGFSSLVIPGAGESNFDSFEANPFETNKQRRETTVHSLLDKLQPSMITLEQNMFGLMDKKSKAVFDGERKAVREQATLAKTEKSMSINKARGGSKSSKKVNRKRVNIIDAARVERVDKATKVQQQIVKRKSEAEQEHDGKPKNALQRFG